jgi:hypothetical protein
LIHQLTIEPYEEISALQKRARKLAMTGGYEIALSSDFDLATGNELAERLLVVLDCQYPKGSAAYKSSLAYRIVMLLEERFQLLGAKE